MPTKIVFLGSKPIGYNCLQYLLENNAKLDIEVIAVRTQLRKEFDGDNNLERLAAQYNVPVLENLEEIPWCDIIYSVQHHELLKAGHIAKARHIAVNLHLAPLPEYRGCNQFSFAILDGAGEFGVTLHQIDTRIDHGDILFERRFAIPENCWVSDLYALTLKHAATIFEQSIPDLVNGNFLAIPQEQLLATRTTSLHYRHEIAAIKKLDLSAGQDYIEKVIRATYMPGFEPPYFTIDGKKAHVRITEN